MQPNMENGKTMTDNTFFILTCKLSALANRMDPLKMYAVDIKDGTCDYYNINQKDVLYWRDRAVQSEMLAFKWSKIMQMANIIWKQITHDC